MPRPCPRDASRRHASARWRPRSRSVGSKHRTGSQPRVWSTVPAVPRSSQTGVPHRAMPLVTNARTRTARPATSRRSSPRHRRGQARQNGWDEGAKRSRLCRLGLWSGVARYRRRSASVRWASPGTPAVTAWSQTQAQLGATRRHASRSADAKALIRQASNERDDTRRHGRRIPTDQKVEVRALRAR